jgi:Tfp pilus assembly protein PilF
MQPMLSTRGTSRLVILGPRNSPVLQRATVIRRDLADLERETSASMSGNTRALLAAGLLASNGLVHDATRAVSAAIVRDPQEPTFYLLLANLLESAGLMEEASDAFRQARTLLSRM